MKDGCLQTAGIVIWVVFVLGALCCGPVGAAELGFKAVGQRMIFTIPYESVPEVNALFSDNGGRVLLALPAKGLKVHAQAQIVDDDWVTAFGIEKVGQKLYWYLEKRDPALKVKSFLALERKKSALQVVLLKEYRPWKVSPSSDRPAAAPVTESGGTKISGKMGRVRKLLESSAGGDNEVTGEASDDVVSPPSLLMSGLRSLIALGFLALIIVALALLLKRYRRGRGGLSGSGLVKVLGVEVVTPKHQVMLLEILDEVMVVGISGEQMTVLTVINDSAKVEELRLLKGGAQTGRRFGGYLKGFLEREPEPKSSVSTEVENALIETTYQRPVAAGPGKTPGPSSGKSEALPENYQEVVSQIKDRLKKSDGSQRR